MSPFVLRRSAARVVLLDTRRPRAAAQRVGSRRPRQAAWWEIPGGGIDPHETSAECAVRELHEEVGITDAEIGPCVWTQHAAFDFGGLRLRPARAGARGVARPPGHETTATRRRSRCSRPLAFAGHRWWDLDELLAAWTTACCPHRLREFLPDLVAGERARPSRSTSPTPNPLVTAPPPNLAGETRHA